MFSHRPTAVRRGLLSFALRALRTLSCLRLAAMRGSLASQCRSVFPKPNTCTNCGTLLRARNTADTDLRGRSAEVAEQKTSGIGLPTCPTRDYSDPRGTKPPCHRIADIFLLPH